MRTGVAMRRLVALLTVVAALTAWGSGVPARSAGVSPAIGGSFAAPFEEPGPRCAPAPGGGQVCKPAGAASIVLANGHILYWNNLEGTENIKINTVAEAGDAAANSQSRLMTLGPDGATWATPAKSDGGGVSEPPEYALPGISDAGGADPNTANNGDLFCSDQVQLADGSILDAGGTNWYLEPRIPGTGFGVSELQGLHATRIFDPATNAWSWLGAPGNMRYARWYPSLVTLANGNVFVASGVSKLLKPL